VGTVWILGAGFSKPLGGPLLGKLLSPESERDLRVRYSKMPQLWTHHASHAIEQFHWKASVKRTELRARTPDGRRRP